ncbi:MAG TPA: L-dopachrome tautomerase-related protein [Woeseiaceae bacterium]|nr:L-dopachrome tautomerase-related protein [Woeseiaceae bacterium]
MRNIVLFILLLAVVAAVVVRLAYGGGEEYPDLSTPPVLDESDLHEVLAYAEPVGNVAVSATGRVFFTVHPEARPRGNRLLEFVEGASVPYPDVGTQLGLFDSVLGITIDARERLWTIDHGNHGLREPRLVAFDLATNTVLRDQVLVPEVAPMGSFLQDLRVSADGGTIVIADTSFWRKSPALIVYDVASGTARRVLEGHPAVSAEGYVVKAGDRALTYLGGLVSLKGGVDGIALGPEWLYFGAQSGSTVHRVRLADLENQALTAEVLGSRVEAYARKPLSAGFALDPYGNLFVTDVEHNAVYVVGNDRELRTLLRSTRLRWPDGLAFGPEDWLYVADSALPELVLQSRAHIAAASPYRLFRFRPAGKPAGPGPLVEPQ